MPSGVIDLRALAMASATVGIAWLAVACEPTVLIGSCPQASSADGGEAGASTTAEEGVIGSSWSTGFEDGMCGYVAAEGYCYARHDATLEMVSSPVRNGKFAAAFTVTGNATDEDRSQARCVRKGELPKTAVYGAWYLVPEERTSDGNWNLFHFLGRDSDDKSHALWDVSLANNADGKLVLSVFNFMTGTHPRIQNAPPIPIGSWFHIQFQLTRSAQMNGQIKLIQDGTTILDLMNLVTDDADTAFGEWYVGNYARTLVPAVSTVYVDDVTISEEP